VQGRRQRVAPLPDARMSKIKRAVVVMAIVDDQPDWDYALNNEKSLEYVHAAAAYFGITEPFSREQKALRDFLVSNLAGRKIAMYAWGVYVDICGDQNEDVLTLTQ
jgi:hypothetical protein